MASDDGLHLDSSGKFVQYDTLGADPRYAHLGESGSTDSGIHSVIPEAPPVTSYPSPPEEAISPVSVDTMSIGKHSELFSMMFRDLVKLNKVQKS